MTSREMINSFYDSLMCDERILSARERDLLTNLLQRTHAHANGENAALTRAIAQAVGEIVAQRSYEVLGDDISRRLLDAQPPFYAKASNSSSNVQRSFADAEVGAILRGSQVWNPPGGGPSPPSPVPPPPSARTRQAQSSSVAVLDLPEILRGDCVILDEFLSPAEMEAVLRYTLEQESAFRVSEVIQPGNTGGIIAYDQRRSRVLMDLGEHHKAIADRIHSCLPQVLGQLGHEVFKVSEVEAQITASNDGDYFRCHSDNAHADNSSREITFVYFFHREPKNFQGGELRVYDSRREGHWYLAAEKYRSVAPQQNQMVFFASSLAHEITPVQCPSRAFADSRFTVNGWLHR